MGILATWVRHRHRASFSYTSRILRQWDIAINPQYGQQRRSRLLFAALSSQCPASPAAYHGYPVLLALPDTSVRTIIVVNSGFNISFTIYDRIAL